MNLLCTGNHASEVKQSRVQHILLVLCVATIDLSNRQSKDIFQVYDVGGIICYKSWPVDYACYVVLERGKEVLNVTMNQL